MKLVAFKFSFWSGITRRFHFSTTTFADSRYAFLINGLVKGFIIAIRYLIDNHLNTECLLSEVECTAVQDLLMVLVCQLDDDPVTTGRLQGLTDRTRRFMITWRLARLRSHRWNQATGVFYPCSTSSDAEALSLVAHGLHSHEPGSEGLGSLSPEIVTPARAYRARHLETEAPSSLSSQSSPGMSCTFDVPHPDTIL